MVICMAEQGINRNASGYYDPTAYMAFINILKDEDKTMDYIKGDIVTIERNGFSKEAVILMVHDQYSTILTLSDNDRLPYSVKCKGIKYTDPGMIQYTFNNNIASYIRSLSDDEYAELIQKAVDSLGYEQNTVLAPEQSDSICGSSGKPATADNASEELIRVKIERDIYKSQYEKLLDSVLAK